MICPICQTEQSSLIKLKNHVAFDDSEICKECLLKHDYGMLLDGLNPGLFIIDDKYVTNAYNSFIIPVTHIQNKRFKFNLPEIGDYEYFFVNGKYNNVIRFRIVGKR